MSKLRKDFPYFCNKQSYTYLDSASSTQKPKVMIEKLNYIYNYQYSNINRSFYKLSNQLTNSYEKVRELVAKLINAKNSKEIIFTKNATEAINLISYSFFFYNIKKEDEIIISIIDHHSNIIPWQQICKQYQTKIKIIKIDINGNINIKEFYKIISRKTKLISISLMSNIFGSIIDIKSIIFIAKIYGIKILLDVCQAILHLPINVYYLNCDFLVFSAHKLYSSTAIGILYGKYDLLKDMNIYQSGGSMIREVTLNKTNFLFSPYKFEPGTPMISEIIVFGTTLQYLIKNEWQKYWKKELNLSKTIIKEIKKIKGYKIIGDQKTPIISIIHDYFHHSDIGEMLNYQNILIRTGHHCNQLLMKSLSIEGTIRISLGIYNNFKDVEKLISSLYKLSNFV